MLGSRVNIFSVNIQFVYSSSVPTNLMPVPTLSITDPQIKGTASVWLPHLSLWLQVKGSLGYMNFWPVKYTNLGVAKTLQFEYLLESGQLHIYDYNFTRKDLAGIGKWRHLVYKLLLQPGRDALQHVIGVGFFFV